MYRETVVICRLACTALIVALTVSSNTGAAVARAPQISVEPQQSIGGSYRTTSFFQIAGQPGATVRGGRLLIKNGGRRPATVGVEPVDAETAQNLGFVYKLSGREIHGVTGWTKLVKRRVTVAPKKTTGVKVSVQIPTSAKAGEYLSGISVQVLEQTQKASTESGVGITSKRRNAVGLMVSIPGPRLPMIKFTGASVERLPAGVTFFLHAKNPGNVVLRKVHGEAEVTRDGKKVLSAPIKPGTFVSATSIKYPLLAINERPAAGTLYRVKATLHYRGGVARLNELVRFGKKQAKRQEEFVGPNEKNAGMPWWPALGLLLVPITAAVRRRRQKSILGRSAGLSLLERELAGFEESGRPLSVIALSGPVSENGTRRKLLAGLRPKLRSSDKICRLSDTELLIISFDTCTEAVAGLAADLRRAVAQLDSFNGDAPEIEAATAQQGITTEQLIEKAVASAQQSRYRKMLGNGDRAGQES